MDCGGISSQPWLITRGYKKKSQWNRKNIRFLAGYLQKNIEELEDILRPNCRPLRESEVVKLHSVASRD